jgi:excisionase family DNA binding protein
MALYDVRSAVAVVEAGTDRTRWEGDREMEADRGSSDVLTLRQAAELTGISASTLARWAEQGRLPFFVGKNGGRLFKREDLEAAVVWLEKRPDEAGE